MQFVSSKMDFMLLYSLKFFSYKYKLFTCILVLIFYYTKVLECISFLSFVVILFKFITFSIIVSFATYTLYITVLLFVRITWISLVFFCLYLSGASSSLALYKKKTFWSWRRKLNCQIPFGFKSNWFFIVIKCFLLVDFPKRVLQHWLPFLPPLSRNNKKGLIEKSAHNNFTSII